MNQLELLAPAGSPEVLRAVLEAGADAVYLGGPAFGARAYANNFTQEELISALDYAHLRGRKIYMTVNTLLKNQEIDRLVDYLIPYYEAGLDAVLVQDLGVLRVIHDHFPDLPIHTSTQMTVTGIEGVRFLQQYGVTRVVMAREVSLLEMKKIHEETGMELEAFVHGALCYCYSGQCLFSSMLGGRSGNRGRCAQPCRLSYTVLNGSHKAITDDTFILSLKDMCGISDLEDLLENGVYSLKIEGRMKGASYAAGVVSLYRKYIDQTLKGRKKASVSGEDRKRLADLGSRCGFTDRYYYQHNGKDMVTFKRPNFSAADNAYSIEVEEKYIRNQVKLPISGSAELQEGLPAHMTVTFGRLRAEVWGQAPSKAQKKPLLLSDVENRLTRSGDTPFAFKDFEIRMDPDIFMPNGALNALRRDALDQLLGRALKSYRRIYHPQAEVSDLSAAGSQTSGNQTPGTQTAAGLASDMQTPGGRTKNKECSLSCLVTTPAQLHEALHHSGLSRIYADTVIWGPDHDFSSLETAAGQAHAAGIAFYPALPFIFRGDTSRIFTDRKDAFSCVDGFLVRNLEEITWVQDYFPEKPFITDHNLYNYNNIAEEELRRRGALLTTMPLELNRSEISHHANGFSEMVIYGRYPLMTTAGCVHKNTAGCDRIPQTLFLRDRYKAEFPVCNYCSECTNVIYNSLPTGLFGYVQELKNAGLHHFRLNFTVENAGECRKLLNAAEGLSGGTFTPSDLSGLGEMTGGHYKRGVE